MAVTASSMATLKGSAAALLRVLRSYLSTLLRTARAGSGTWRVLAVIFALLNVKNLPLVWHFRVFRSFAYQLYLQPQPISATSLFEPMITSTRSPAMECDYNLHKSNSTYFSDFDVSRSHLVSAIIRKGWHKENKNRGPIVAPIEGMPPAPAGRSYVALGGICCFFRREIKPFQKFEIWTRVLCWDRKWLYIVSHMVKSDTVKPSRFSLQPWKKGTKQPEEDEKTRRERLRNTVFATSLARYVFKRGRVTIPPEQVLIASEMLPARPDEGATSTTGGIEATGQLAEPANGEVAEDSILPALSISKGSDWTWEKVEAERARGMRLAALFDGLDGLHDEFEGGANGALGEYGDLFW